jgi:putative FmdB family regulatory protein
MPIYEYQCQSCDHEFEALQKISDPLLTDCPSCSEQALRKKVSAAAFRLKGGGWYETDFKTGNKKNVIGADRAGKNDGNKGEGKSADSKSGDNKSGDGKSGDSKSSENKSAPSAKTAAPTGASAG